MLAAFMATGLADPGMVTPATLPAHLATPYDGVTNRAAACSTCGLQRPARAKHCNICGGCGRPKGAPRAGQHVVPGRPAGLQRAEPSVPNRAC